MSNVRVRLLRKASMNKELAARVVPLFKGASEKDGLVLTASQRQDLVEAISIVQGRVADASETSPVKEKIDHISNLRQRLVLAQKKFELAIQQVGSLEEAEKKGVEGLKDAAKELGKKAKLLVDAENALLEWTAFYQEQRPRIEQVAVPGVSHLEPEKKNPENSFEKITAKLNETVPKQIAAILTECTFDLTRSVLIIKGLKIAIKSVNLHPQILKSAGILEAYHGVLEWLDGKISPLLAKALSLKDTLADTVKGFESRTKKLETAVDALKSALGDAEKEINAAFPKTHKASGKKPEGPKEKSPTMEGAKKLLDSYLKELVNPRDSELTVQDFYDPNAPSPERSEKMLGFAPSKAKELAKEIMGNQSVIEKILMTVPQKAFKSPQTFTDYKAEVTKADTEMKGKGPAEQKEITEEYGTTPAEMLKLLKIVDDHKLFATFQLALNKPEKSDTK